jgi:hypothetical protein
MQRSGWKFIMWKKYLHDTSQFKDLKITLDTTRQISEEQVLEKVKEHFNA